MTITITKVEKIEATGSIHTDGALSGQNGGA